MAITALSFAIMAFFAGLTLQVKPLDPLSGAIKNFSFTDIYYEILKETAPADTSDLITIVDMTQLYRRGEHAQALADIASLHPKAVGVDVVFDVEKDDFEGNDSLMQVVAANDNIVFSFKLEGEYQGDSIGFEEDTHSFFKQYIDFKEGFCNMPRGGLYDGMKREIPVEYRLNGEPCRSLIAQTANTYAGMDLFEGRTSDVKINYSPKVFRVIKPQDVKKHPEWIQDRIVFYGAMHEAADYHWTPVGKIAGVVVLAYGVETVLQSTEIHELPFWGTLIISFLFSLCVLYLQQNYRRITGSSKNLFVRFMLGSTYVLSICTFLFTSVLIGFCFLLFSVYGLSISLGWALSSIAFLTTSSNMYDAIKDYIVNKRNKSSNTNS